MKKVWMCGTLTVLCIIAAVFLRKDMADADLDYSKVQVRVISSESTQRRVRTKYSTSHVTSYDVRVSYQGEEYDLKNCHDSYSYREGQNVTAYLYKGKLYANEEGVRSASVAGIAYFVALFASIGLFVLTLVLLSKAKKKQ